jgi:hypothetical protein
MVSTSSYALIPPDTSLALIPPDTSLSDKYCLELTNKIAQYIQI